MAPRVTALATIAEVLHEEPATLVASHNIANGKCCARAAKDIARRHITAAQNHHCRVVKDVEQLEEEVDYLYGVVERIAPLQRQVQVLEKEMEVLRSQLARLLPLVGSHDMGLNGEGDQNEKLPQQTL